MKVYVATKIANLNNGIKLAYKLQRMGIEVTSRWLECEGEERPDPPEGGNRKEFRNSDFRWQKFAEKWGQYDLDDVARADAVILLPQDECVGTWVEFGYALGLRKPIYYVGNRGYSVFSHLDPKKHPIKYFKEVGDLINFLSIAMMAKPLSDAAGIAVPGIEPAKISMPYPDLYGDVVDFHDKFGVPFSRGKRDGYRIPSEELQKLKFTHMHEELDEYEKAIAAGDMEGALDALVDLVYVVLGTARAHNFPFNEAWCRVHAKNMTKKRALKASESKRGSAFDIVKPEGWVPASLIDLLEADLHAGTKLRHAMPAEEIVQTTPFPPSVAQEPGPGWA